MRWHSCNMRSSGYFYFMSILFLRVVRDFLNMNEFMLLLPHVLLCNVQCAVCKFILILIDRKSRKIQIIEVQIF